MKNLALHQSKKGSIAASTILKTQTYITLEPPEPFTRNDVPSATVDSPL